MGLGPPVLELYRQLKILGAFEGVRDVMELGSQDFWCPQQNLVRALCAAFGRGEPAPELLRTSNASQLPARLLYEALGLTYQCVDVDGRAGSLVLDMNFDGAPQEHIGNYDLVTNHGTSEHLLNQYNVFKLMHDFTRPGGIMIHAVPFTVHLEHGFFNYQPNFFECLARYNSYEILGLWVGPDWQLPSFVPWQPELLDFLMLSSKTTHLLVVALRKLYAADFRVPFQGHYEGTAPEAVLGRYAVTVDGEAVSGARIKYLSRSDLLAKDYLAKNQELKASLKSCRRQIDELQHALADAGPLDSRAIERAIEELAKIKAQLSETGPLAHGSQQLAQEFAYEGRGQTASIIPQDPSKVTREHGASIMRIMPRPEHDFASLQLRALINCCVSESNSVVIAVFQDGKDHPVALMSEPLPPNEMSVVDEEVSIAAEGSSAPPAFEIRVGLANPGGALFLNHAPGEDTARSVSSRIRVRWMPEDLVDRI
jgi:SAM-dependent methyltransferase